MIRRPSKSFVYLMVFLCPLTVALFFGLLPEVPGFAARPIPGEITFSSPKPTFRTNTQVSKNKNSTFHPSEWLEDGYENLMKWEYNPWKTNKYGEFGEHYGKLLESTNPSDIAYCKEIQRRAEAWYQKLLLRFPEMAVTMKTVPDDQNGFLKWLEFCERIKKSSGSTSQTLGFPKELDQSLNTDCPWNSEAARAWLTQQKSVVDEIRAIGLMPDESLNGLAVERWGYPPVRLALDSARCLMMEARLYAEEGNVTAAMESIRAAKGFADHFTEVETPTVLNATAQIMIQNELERRVLREIMPALPSGQVDPAAWESILNPNVPPASEFARYTQGYWSSITRQYILPLLLDAEDPHCPPDGGDLLDIYSLEFLEIARIQKGATLADLPTLHGSPPPDLSQLYRTSRKIAENFLTGQDDLVRCWDRAPCVSGMTQAAFAILKGQPIPQDPIYGKDYQWDPVTRQLSMPAGKEFEGMRIKPIIVPKLTR